MRLASSDEIVEELLRQPGLSINKLNSALYRPEREFSQRIVEWPSLKAKLAELHAAGVLTREKVLRRGSVRIPFYYKYSVARDYADRLDKPVEDRARPTRGVDTRWLGRPGA